MTELTNILGKSYEKLKKILRRTYEKVMKKLRNAKKGLENQLTKILGILELCTYDKVTTNLGKT